MNMAGRWIADTGSGAGPHQRRAPPIGAFLRARFDRRVDMQSVGMIAIAALPLLVFLLCLLMLGYGLRQLRVALALRRSDGSIADVGGGYAHARGTAKSDGATLEAPFTGTTCVAYEAAVEQLVRTGPENHPGKRWQSKETLRESREFLIEDDTGRVRVQPAEADWKLGVSHEHHVDEGEAPTGSYAAFIEDRDVFIFDDEAVAETHDFRFVERRIDVDGPATILGPSRSETTGRARATFARGDTPLAWLRRPYLLSNDEIDRSYYLDNGLKLMIIGLPTAVGMLAFLRAILLS